MTTNIRDERSLGELFSDLSKQTSTLVHQEVELARHELTRSITSVARESALIAIGGLLAYLGVLVVLIGIAWLLSQLGVAIWLAFLIVGAVTVLIGAIVGLRAWQSLQKVRVVPEQTIETLKDDVQLAKDQTR